MAPIFHAIKNWINPIKSFKKNTISPEMIDDFMTDLSAHFS